MARYIDLNEAIKHLHFDCKAKYPLSYCNGISAAINEIGKLPTADVVPKSEVDKLELTLQWVMRSVDKWLDEADYDADPIKRAITMREKTLQIVENEKTEVAMEIFEEIEKHLFVITPIEEFDGWARMMLCDFERLKKKYTEGKT